MKLLYHQRSIDLSRLGTTSTNLSRRNISGDHAAWTGTLVHNDQHDWLNATLFPFILSLWRFTDLKENAYSMSIFGKILQLPWLFDSKDSVLCLNWVEIAKCKCCKLAVFSICRKSKLIGDFWWIWVYTYSYLLCKEGLFRR